jgi:hypothetical protein
MSPLRFTVAAVALAAGCGSDGTTLDPITGIDAGVGEEPGDPPDARVPETDPPDGGVVTRACEGVTMTLGTGNREFTPVTEGDLVYLFKGPQGGYMIYLSVRAKGIDRDDSTLCYDEYVVDTDLPVGAKCWKIRLTNDLGDGVYERVGVWGELDERYWTYPSAVRGHMLRVRATLSDASGCEASDSWTAEVSTESPK